MSYEAKSVVFYLNSELSLISNSSISTEVLIIISRLFNTWLRTSSELLFIFSKRIPSFTMNSLIMSFRNSDLN